MRYLKCISIIILCFMIYSAFVILGLKSTEYEPVQALAEDVSAEGSVQVWRTGYPDSASGMPCCVTQHTQCVESVENVDDGWLDGIVTRIDASLPIPAEIEAFLVSELEQYDILYWYPYAVAQIWAESSCNAAAESKDGQDKGLLQYRASYWEATCRQYGIPEGTSVFDWKAQIQVYVQQTAWRLAQGCSVAETVSRHKQSDWGPYDPEYVKLVFSYVRIPNSCDWDAAYDMGVRE